MKPIMVVKGYLLGLGLLFLTHLCSDLSAANSSLAINKTIQSKVLSKSTQYRVWLPESYEPNGVSHYPLLIILDGQKYGDLVSNNAQFLAYSGEIPEHIIIALDVQNRLLNYTPTDSKHWVGDGGAPDFLNYIFRELLPAINNDYRLNKTRILWGHSAAGLFTIYAFLNAPDSFNAYLVNDGSLDWDNQYIHKALKEHLVKQAKQKQFLYLNTSFLDPDAPEEFKFIDPIVDTLNSDATPNLRWVYEAMPTESHATIPLLGSIHGLKTLYEGYRIPESVMFKGLSEVKAYFDKVKGRIGARINIPESVLVETGLIAMQHHPKDAISTFHYCISQYPESLIAREKLSEAYIINEQPELAIKILEQAINIALVSDKDQVDEFRQKLDEIRTQLETKSH